MASHPPVTVTWKDERGTARYKRFHIIATAQKFAKGLHEQDLSWQIWIQGEIFESDKDGNVKAYDPRYEIPY